MSVRSGVRVTPFSAMSAGQSQCSRTCQIGDRVGNAFETGGIERFLSWWPYVDEFSFLKL